MEPADEAPETYRFDRVVGLGLILCMAVFYLWRVAWTVLNRAHESEAVRRLYDRYALPLWMEAVASLLGLAVIVLIGLGIMRGRGLALLIGGLMAAQETLWTVGAAQHAPATSLQSARLVVSMVLVVYAGLRLMGVLGPRPGVSWLRRD